MFRITRGISLDHAPAFPNPSFRFPDGATLPIYGDAGVRAEEPGADDPSEASNPADPQAPDASSESPSTAPP